ncbi:MAG: hypothetical protein M1822_004813 [Bathelium mastoideum]|nr:MAG: hypothetical protein M1822_004813 [Bathelium mastoideum]
MYSPPYIFFHHPKGYSWDEGTDPALHKLRTLNDAPDGLIPSLTINVSQPDALMTWLRKNNAALISDLFVFVDAASPAASAQRWYLLFDKLRRKAMNIQNLSVYWDADGPWGRPTPWRLEDVGHSGLGKSVVFVRGLALLKVKKSVNITGWYAKLWPGYLKEKLGLEPVDKQNVPGSYRRRELKDYQRGTQRLNPWTDTKDTVPWDQDLRKGSFMSDASLLRYR